MRCVSYSITDRITYVDFSTERMFAIYRGWCCWVRIRCSIVRLDILAFHEGIISHKTGIGAADVALENHYKVSSKGLDERWGDSYVTHSLSNGGKITAQNPIISDSSARTEGKSDINIYARYPWSFKAGFSAQGTWKLTTAVKYVRKDAKNKRIRVRHSWKTTHS